MRNIFILPIALLAGCQTVDPPIVHVDCPTTAASTEDGSWGTADVEQMEAARAGCHRIYSPKHCLVRFVRRSELNYWAVCQLGG